MKLVEVLTTPEQKKSIGAYIEMAKKKSELERMADAKAVSGAFTGSYAINPVNGEKVPVWIADYGYWRVMVPAPLWPYHRATSAITCLPNSMIYP